MSVLLSIESSSAPDVAGPIEAWRVWRVVAHDGAYVLGSLIKPRLWPPRKPLLAECLRERALLVEWLRRRQRHAAPAMRCECGVYAAGSLPQLRQYLNESSLQPAVGRVLGQVALWGRVVECERGYRASHAYPQRIFVPSDACDRQGPTRGLVEDLAAYGVPVEMLDIPRSKALEVLAGRAA